MTPKCPVSKDQFSVFRYSMTVALTSIFLQVILGGNEDQVAPKGQDTRQVKSLIHLQSSMWANRTSESNRGAAEVSSEVFCQRLPFPHLLIRHARTHLGHPQLICFVIAIDLHNSIFSLTTFNPRSAGVSGRTRRAGGGGKNYPPPLLTHEPGAVARLAKRQSKALNKYFRGYLKKKS